MIMKSLVLGIASLFLLAFVYLGISSGAKDAGGIPAEKVADMFIPSSSQTARFIRSTL